MDGDYGGPGAAVPQFAENDALPVAPAGRGHRMRPRPGLVGVEADGQWAAQPPSHPQAQGFPHGSGNLEAGDYPQTQGFPHGSGHPETGNYPSYPQAQGVSHGSGNPEAGGYPSYPQAQGFPHGSGHPETGNYPSYPQAQGASRGLGNPEAGDYPQQLPTVPARRSVELPPSGIIPQAPPASGAEAQLPVPFGQARFAQNTAAQSPLSFTAAAPHPTPATTTRDSQDTPPPDLASPIQHYPPNEPQAALMSGPEFYPESPLDPPAPNNSRRQSYASEQPDTPEHPGLEQRDSHVPEVDVALHGGAMSGPAFFLSPKQAAAPPPSTHNAEYRMDAGRADADPQDWPSEADSMPMPEPCEMQAVLPPAADETPEQSFPPSPSPPWHQQNTSSTGGTPFTAERQPASIPSTATTAFAQNPNNQSHKSAGPLDPAVNPQSHLLPRDSVPTPKAAARPERMRSNDTEQSRAGTASTWLGPASSERVGWPASNEDASCRHLSPEHPVAALNGSHRSRSSPSPEHVFSHSPAAHRSVSVPATQCTSPQLLGSPRPEDAAEAPAASPPPPLYTEAGQPPADQHPFDSLAPSPQPHPGMATANAYPETHPAPAGGGSPPPPQPASSDGEGNRRGSLQIPDGVHVGGQKPPRSPPARGSSVNKLLPVYQGRDPRGRYEYPHALVLDGGDAGSVLVSRFPAEDDFMLTSLASGSVADSALTKSTREQAVKRAAQRRQRERAMNVGHQIFTPPPAPPLRQKPAHKPDLWGGLAGVTPVTQPLAAGGEWAPGNKLEPAVLVYKKERRRVPGGSTGVADEAEAMRRFDRACKARDGAGRPGDDDRIASMRRTVDNFKAALQTGDRHAGHAAASPKRAAAAAARGKREYPFTERELTERAAAARQAASQNQRAAAVPASAFAARPKPAPRHQQAPAPQALALGQPPAADVATLGTPLFAQAQVEQAAGPREFSPGQANAAADDPRDFPVEDRPSTWLSTGEGATHAEAEPQQLLQQQHTRGHLSTGELANVASERVSGGAASVASEQHGQHQQQQQSTRGHLSTGEVANVASEASQQLRGRVSAGAASVASEQHGQHQHQHQQQQQQQQGASGESPGMAPGGGADLLTLEAAFVELASRQQVAEALLDAERQRVTDAERGVARLREELDLTQELYRAEKEVAALYQAEPQAAKAANPQVLSFF
ncbi:hypothetical protein DIPPA_24008 [Diplonema papillatum]|nr:hypothetical protein DIPPA_24008 [Diplonema papillatum]